MNYLLQFFVFDKSGNQIIDANAIPCETREERDSLANELISNYENSPQRNDLGLLISSGKEVLYNSKEEQQNAKNN